MSVEERIQAAIRADATRGREVERIGPFVATFNRTTENPYLNYAIPAPGAEPSPRDVEELVDAYARHGRTPRLEYAPRRTHAPVTRAELATVARPKPARRCPAA